MPPMFSVCMLAIERGLNSHGISLCCYVFYFITDIINSLIQYQKQVLKNFSFWYLVSGPMIKIGCFLVKGGR